MVTAPVRCNGAGRVVKTCTPFSPNMILTPWAIVIDELTRPRRAVRRCITRALNFARRVHKVTEEAATFASGPEAPYNKRDS